MKITVTKDVTDDVLQILEAAKNLRNSCICVGGLLNDGFASADKGKFAALLTSFVDEISSADVNEIIDGMKANDNE